MVDASISLAAKADGTNANSDAAIKHTSKALVPILIFPLTLFHL
jgi:hypothetical protein